MHFDLTDLRLFVAVADAGSITAGASGSALSLAAASARCTNSLLTPTRKAPPISLVSRNRPCASSSCQ